MRRGRPRRDVLALTTLAVSPPVRMWVAALVGAAAAWTEAMPARAAAGDGDDHSPGIVKLAPPQSQAFRRGREAGLRFDLARRFDLVLQVNNAFSAQNRKAIADVAARIAKLPGVRKVIGPAGLLALRVDAGGRVSATPLLAAGPNDDTANATDDDVAETIRQRLIRRSDAVGWFISRDGTELHLLIDTEDFAAIQVAVETAVASSGLVLLGGVAPATPLWPIPAREPRPLALLLSLSLLGLAILIPALAMAVMSGLTTARTLLAAGTAGVAAAAPALLAPAGGLRPVALGAGVGAALLFAVIVLVVETIRRRRSQSRSLLPPRMVHVRVPVVVQVPAALMLIAAVALSPRLTMGTQLWRHTSVFFVEIRGDLDEPVVLREVRRLTDFLRAEAGVAHAWSIADLFFAVPAAGEAAAGIPHDARIAHAILERAAADEAVRLELAWDHRTGLIGVRLDDESGVDRLVVLDHLETYLAREHRSTLLRVDASEARLSPATRAFGRGILAADARERVLRICARSGRNLSPAEVESIERGVRRAALVPIVDLPRLKTEMRQEVNTFLDTAAVAAESHADLPRLIDRQRLADELFAQPADATVADVLASLRLAWGRRLPQAVLDAQAVELARRLTSVRRRHSARINFNDMLYGADLPTEGMLSEEVRDATLEAMGPVVGVPVARNAPGAFSLEAVAIGGAPCDRALSVAWLPRMKLGLLIAGALTALVLGAVGGVPALAWWPVSVGFVAPLLLFPEIAGIPVGTLYLSVLAGAFAAGVAFAVAFAPGRREE
jgi:hypothetical protein